MKLPKVESIIITVFFLCIALWAISKCGSRRSQLVQRGKEDTEQEERPTRRDTVFVPQAPVQTQVQTQPQVQPQVVQPQTYAVPQAQPVPAGTLPQLQRQQPGTTAPITGQPQAVAPSAAQPATAVNPNAKYSTLFVTIDGLKMRKEPSLKGALVAKLDLYEQVFFLNKKSEKTEEISLGYEKVTDYWVKVRTKSGKEGWVFGAGVHYYKMKRKGVLE